MRNVGVQSSSLYKATKADPAAGSWLILRERVKNDGMAVKIPAVRGLLKPVKVWDTACMRRLSKMPSDPSKAAALTVRMVTESDNALPERDAVTNYLAEIGRRGGIKGGKARAAKLSDKRKKEIAKKAALARWNATKK